MICKIKDLKTGNGYNNRVRLTPSGIIGGLKFWLCKRRKTHDFDLVLDEWRNGNVSFDEWPCGDHLSDVPTVGLKVAERWCNRHTVLRCSRCGFEWERSFSGVKGCGGHTWIAGREWPVEWKCLPWGDPYATVQVGTSLIPSSVMQINDPTMSHLRKIRV